MSDLLRRCTAELYGALQDTSLDPGYRSTPDRTPTALPGLSVHEPDPDRGWKLGEGVVYDPEIVQSMKVRAKRLGYILVIEPHQPEPKAPAGLKLTVYHRRGQKMARPKTFYSIKKAGPTKKLDQYTADPAGTAPPDLPGEAKAIPLHEFLDRRNTMPLSEHYDTDTDDRVAERHIHAYADPAKLQPSELDSFGDLAGTKASGSRKNIKQMVAHLKRGGDLPPITVEGLLDDPEYAPSVIDGHHRTVAHLLAGRNQIPITYGPETLVEIWAKANGQPADRSNVQKLLKAYGLHIRRTAKRKPDQYQLDAPPAQTAPDLYAALWQACFDVERYAHIPNSPGQRHLFDVGKPKPASFRDHLQSKIGTLDGKLLHGTAADVSSGIEPMVGDFVRNAYEDEYRNAGIDFDDFATPLVYMSPLSGPHLHDPEKPGDTAFTAMQHQVAHKLNKGFHDVTKDDIAQHGVMAILNHEPHFTQITKQGRDYGHYPDGWLGVEPSDVVSEEAVMPERTLNGPDLADLWEHYAGDQPLRKRYAQMFHDALLDRYARRYKPDPRQRGLFDESEHPRGQPENKGEFAKKSAPNPGMAAPNPADTPTHQQQSRAKDRWMQGATMQHQRAGLSPRDAAHQAALDWQEQENMQAEYEKQNPPVLGGKLPPNDAVTTKDIQSKTHTVRDVVSGRFPVGVHSSNADERIARDAGLYTTRVGKLLVYAKDQESAAPLVDYLNAGGKYGTPEFSRLLGYTPEEINEYSRFLKSQGRHDLLSTPPDVPVEEHARQVTDALGRHAETLANWEQDLKARALDPTDAGGGIHDLTAPIRPDGPTWTEHLAGQQPAAERNGVKLFSNANRHAIVKDGRVYVAYGFKGKALFDKLASDPSPAGTTGSRPGGSNALTGGGAGQAAETPEPLWQRRYGDIVRELNEEVRQEAAKLDPITQRLRKFHLDHKSARELQQAIAPGLNPHPDAVKAIRDYLNQDAAITNKRDEFQERIRQHRWAIRQALEQGHPVPPEVMADYPDLAKSRPNPDIAGQNPDTPPAQNVGESAQVPTNPDTTGHKRPNPPQVASPTLHKRGVSLTTATRDESVRGNEYMLPGFEEYRIVIVPPRGSKAKHNKRGWEAYEATSGLTIVPDRFATQDEASTAAKAAELLRRVSKPDIDRAIQETTEELKRRRQEQPRPEQHRALTSALTREFYAQRFARQVCRRYAERENQDYAGEHAAPMRDSGSPAHDLTANGTYPEDVYGQHAVRYYGDGSEHDQESFRIAHSLRGKPNAKVRIYRAVPLSTEDQIARHETRKAQILKRGGEPGEYDKIDAEIQRLRAQPAQKPMAINRGDWVTINRRYAHSHGKSALNGQYRVLSKVVPAAHLYTNGDSIHEWGYDPGEPADKMGQRFADALLERYAQQRTLFDADPPPPRRDFDETKHARETGTSGKFARKYPRVMSQEVQPALPGVDLPAERRVVTRKNPVAQGIAPAPTREQLLAQAGQKMRSTWDQFASLPADQRTGALGKLQTDTHGMLERQFGQHLSHRDALTLLSHTFGDDLPFDAQEIADAIHRRHPDKLDVAGLMLDAHHRLWEDQRQRRRAEAVQNAGDARAIKFGKPGSDVKFVVHPAAHADYQGQWQITRFDDRGPAGHQYHKTKEEAIGAAIGAHPNSYWDEGDSDFQIEQKYTLVGRDTPFRPRDSLDVAAELYGALWNARYGLDRYTEISLRDAVKPSPLPGLTDRQRARYGELLGKRNRTPEEHQELQAIKRRSEDHQDRQASQDYSLEGAGASLLSDPRVKAPVREIRQGGAGPTTVASSPAATSSWETWKARYWKPTPVTRERYTETPAHWQHDPAPPTDESAYIDANEHHRRLYEFYRDRNASSRTTPSELPNPPIGTWRMDPRWGIYGREIDQLRMVPLQDLELSEEDWTNPKINYEGRGDDARRYSGWMKQHGIEHLPPIAVMETEAGKHRVIDGHRRTAAAKLAGMTHIPAWVSPTMSTGKKYYGQDRDIKTGLTYEGAHHGAEAASKMYGERQKQLMQRIEAERAGLPEQHRQPGTPDRYTVPLAHEMTEQEFHAAAIPADQASEIVAAHRSGDQRSKNQGSYSPEGKTGPLVHVMIPTSLFSRPYLQFLRESTNPDRVKAYAGQQIDTPVYALPPRDRSGRRTPRHWQVSDGGHRLLAAIDRGDRYIPALTEPDAHRHIVDHLKTGMVAGEPHFKDRYMQTLHDAFLDRYRAIAETPDRYTAPVPHSIKPEEAHASVEQLRQRRRDDDETLPRSQEGDTGRYWSLENGHTVGAIETGNPMFRGRQHEFAEKLVGKQNALAQLGVTIPRHLVHVQGQPAGVAYPEGRYPYVVSETLQDLQEQSDESKLPTEIQQSLARARQAGWAVNLDKGHFGRTRDGRHVLLDVSEFHHPDHYTGPDAAVDRYKKHQDSPGQRTMDFEGAHHGHDVSGEARDQGGRWTGGKTAEDPVPGTGRDSAIGDDRPHTGTPRASGLRSDQSDDSDLVDMGSRQPHAGAATKPAESTNESLVAAAQSGDREAAGLLWQRNLGLVTQWVRKYVKRPQDQDDAVQDVAAEVLPAVLRNFAPEKGQFTTYLTNAIRNHFIGTWQKEQKRPHEHQLDDPDADGFREPVASPEPPRMEIQERAQAVRRALATASLSPREREVVEASFGIDRPAELQARIGERMSLNPRSVSVILRRALEKLTEEAQDQLKAHYGATIREAFLERYAQQAGQSATPSVAATPVHHTKTPEFKNFFGDWENEPHKASKVVHPETQHPLVVYHGTGRQQFDSFHDWRPNFFTPSREYAEGYLGGKKTKTGRMIKAYLSIKNPFNPATNEDHRRIYNEQFVPYAKENSYDKDRYYPLEPGDQVPFTTADHLFVWLRKMRREGTHNFDGYQVDEKFGSYPHSWVPLSNTQIKTVKNRGTWDPNDERMDYEQEGQQPVNYAQQFHDALLERYAVRKRPHILNALSAEAAKAGSYENFRKDFHHQLKHGLYWHWTDDPNFAIDPHKGPQDVSSMAVSGSTSPGKLMVSSDIDAWKNYGNAGKGRPYAALVDLSGVERPHYHQVGRGFGNEFIVHEPKYARVVKVMPRKQAMAFDRQQRQHLPASEQELEEFYHNAVAHDAYSMTRETPDRYAVPTTISPKGLVGPALSKLGGAIKQGIGRLAGQAPEPTPPPKPIPGQIAHGMPDAAHFVLSAPQTPAMDRLRTTLGTLYHDDALHHHAHQLASAHAARTAPRSGPGRPSYERAYQQHLPVARQQVYEHLRAQVPALLEAAQAEHDHHLRRNDHAALFARQRVEFAGRLRETDPTRKIAMEQHQRVSEAASQHRQHVTKSLTDLRRWADKIPDLQQPVAPPVQDQPNPKLARQTELLQAERDHTRRVKELQRAGLEVPQGPSGDPILDARDPAHQAAVAKLYRESQPTIQRPRQRAAAPAPNPLEDYRTAVELTTTPGALDQEIKRQTAQEIKRRVINPRANDPFARAAKLRIRDEVTKRLTDEARQRAVQLGQQARQWHESKGLPVDELDALDERLKTPEPKKPEPAAQPVVRDQAGNVKPVTDKNLARQEAAKEKREERAAQQAPAERQKTAAQQAKEQNETMAREYGWTPKEYDRRAQEIWKDRLERAQALQKAQRAVKLSIQERQAAARGQDEDKVKGTDTMTDLGEQFGLEHMTQEQIYDLAKRAPIQIPGPHDPAWHQEVVDQLRRQGIVPFSERQNAPAEPPSAEPDDGLEDLRRQAFETGVPLEELLARREREPGQDDEEPPPTASDDEPVPFTARRQRVAQDLYSALWWASVTRV